VDRCLEGVRGGLGQVVGGKPVRSMGAVAKWTAGAVAAATECHGTFPSRGGESRSGVVGELQFQADFCGVFWQFHHKRPMFAAADRDRTWRRTWRKGWFSGFRGIRHASVRVTHLALQPRASSRRRYRSRAAHSPAAGSAAVAVAVVPRLQAERQSSA